NHVKALALALALAVAPAPAALSQSADGPECVSLADIKAEVEHAGLSYTEYSGITAKAIVLGVTDKLGPPPTDAVYLADPIIVVKLGDKVKIGFVVEDCYIGSATMAITTWNEIIQKAGSNA